jgi:hypothetical protein
VEGFRNGPRWSANASSALGRLFPIGRDSSGFGLTVKLTVNKQRLVFLSNGDNGLEMKEMIEWE